MRIVIVGAGAVGGYFGARLLAADRDVRFLVRPQRAQTLVRDGLRVRSLSGELEVLDAPIVIVGEPAQPADLVLLSVKAYALEQAIRDIAPMVGEKTMILPLLNGMRHVDLLRAAFGPECVIGGVAIVVTQLEDDGTVHQIGPGAAISFGEFDGSLGERMHGVADALGNAGFRSTRSPTIEHDMWEKWMLLAAGGALNTLLRGSIGDIVAAPGGLDAAQAVLHETFAIAAAAGFPPREAARTRVTTALTEAGSSFTTSMYRDLRQGRPVEAQQIVGDLIDRGRASGVAVPMLALAYAALCIYQETDGAA